MLTVVTASHNTNYRPTTRNFLVQRILYARAWPQNRGGLVMAGPNLVTVNKEVQTRPCIEGNAHRQNCISVNVDWGASSRCHLIVVRLEGVGAVSQSPDKFTSLRRCLERYPALVWRRI